MSYIQRIWNDKALYGHCLTNLPKKLWDFTTSDDLLFYQKPDPGSAKRIYLIFEMYTVVTRRWPNGNIRSFYGATNILLAKYLELGVRRIGGSVLTICIGLLLAPFVFLIKTTHLVVRQFFQERYFLNHVFASSATSSKQPGSSKR